MMKDTELAARVMMLCNIKIGFGDAHFEQIMHMVA